MFWVQHMRNKYILLNTECQQWIWPTRLANTELSERQSIRVRFLCVSIYCYLLWTDFCFKPTLWGRMSGCHKFKELWVKGLSLGIYIVRVSGCVCVRTFHLIFSWLENPDTRRKGRSLSAAPTPCLVYLGHTHTERPNKCWIFTHFELWLTTDVTVPLHSATLDLKL